MTDEEKWRKYLMIKKLLEQENLSQTDFLAAIKEVARGLGL